MPSELEKNIKDSGVEDLTRTEKGSCPYCGAQIVTFWGIKLVRPVTAVYGPPSRATQQEVVNVGPVCEGCGLMYSPFHFKS